jgi:hypothetical protein
MKVKVKLFLLIGLGITLLLISVANLITSSLSSILGIGVATEVGCLVFVVLIVLIAIPWLIFSSKFKQLKKIKELQISHPNRYCSQCGKPMADMKFGKFCEFCQRYA